MTVILMLTVTHIDVTADVTDTLGTVLIFGDIHSYIDSHTGIIKYMTPRNGRNLCVITMHRDSSGVNVQRCQNFLGYFKNYYI